MGAILRSPGKLARLHAGGRLARLRSSGLAGLGSTQRRRGAGRALDGVVMAFFVFGMPAKMILASAVVGLVFAAFRVVWLIVAAVFLYDIAVSTGQFEIMKASVARLSGDRRLQAVLIAFSFGAFIEGAAGFGHQSPSRRPFWWAWGSGPFRRPCCA